MNRRDIPEFSMNEVGSDSLRSRGILVMGMSDSVRDDPRRLQPHFHNFFQMYLLFGHTRVMQDFEEYSLTGPSVVFLSPGQVHTLRRGSSLDGYTVSFTQAFFDDQTPPPSRLLEFPFFYTERDNPSITLDERELPPIAALFESLQEEYEQARPDAEEVLRTTLRLLLLRLSRLSHQPVPHQAVSRARTLMRQFSLAVEKHFRECHHLADYARLLGVSENHLNDTVRKQTGLSAGSLIRKRRLLDAKRLLLHSDMGVAEICFLLRFKEPSYFARFFRRYEGLSPTEFRDRIREKYRAGSREGGSEASSSP